MRIDSKEKLTGDCVRLSRRSSQPVTAGFSSVPAPAVLQPVHRRFMSSFLEVAKDAPGVSD